MDHFTSAGDRLLVRLQSGGSTAWCGRICFEDYIPSAGIPPVVSYDLCIPVDGTL